MDCPRFHELVDDYLADRLDAADRASFRAHLAGCEDCRAAASIIDPSLVFAAMPATTASQADVDACVTAVTARIRHDRLQRRLAPRRSPWLAAAATVIVILGGSLLWRGASTSTVPQPLPTPAMAAAEYEPPPPQVEVQGIGPGVRVYQYADGANKNTAAVFIVDEGFEL